MSNAAYLFVLSSSVRSFVRVYTSSCANSLVCARLTTYTAFFFFFSRVRSRLYLRNVVDAHASLGVINAIIISTKRSYRPAVFSSSTVVFLVPTARPSNSGTFIIPEMLVHSRGINSFFPIPAYLRFDRILIQLYHDQANYNAYNKYWCTIVFFIAFT